MRLFTHNFLQCHVRKCSDSSDNFPLSITDAEIEIRETDFNADFIRTLVPKIDWPALSRTAQELKISTNVPAEMPEPEALEDEEMLREVHRILMDHFIQTGTMTCRSCGHLYPIKDGIPNMLLGEDEI